MKDTAPSSPALEREREREREMVQEQGFFNQEAGSAYSIQLIDILTMHLRKEERIIDSFCSTKVKPEYLQMTLFPRLGVE